MPVYEERPGRWCAEVTIQGKRYRERGTDRRELERWAQLTKLQGFPPPKRGKVALRPFGELVREARRNRADWRTSRDPSLDQRLEELVRLIGPETETAAIDLPVINKAVRELEARPGRDGRGLSPKTVNRYLAALSGVLTYARSCGYLTAVPELPWREEAPGRMVTLAPDQEDAVCAELSPEHALCVRVLAATALRPGEFFSLERDQVDVEGGWLHLWKTKTDRPRSVPIEPALARPLVRLIEEGRVPKGAEVYRALKAAVESLGLPGRTCVYSLRHTGLTRLAKSGVAGPVLQKWAGHGDYRTTQNYVHLADEDLKRAAGMVRRGPREAGLRRA